MKNNILLIGFMGVGKSTIGRMLCKNNQDKFFLDTDDLIESFYGDTIANIFASHSEEYFRKLEYRVASWLSLNMNNSVIATGGGFYKSYNMKEIGKVIYLKSEFENIIKRLKYESDFTKEVDKRPLLKDLDNAKKLYNSRVLEYQEIADETIEVDNLSLEKITSKLR
ncbi:MAG: Shikimate kinase I (EC [uncultured Campylobacterales bacterium]|uniref:Shikimate kinase n=1 Tax=uncultured Campylobacterales bacterium TaxID=352960 RepID=A0A6S6RWM7_9BACT|nr:MAG: Shikimate kinase I (EC [uncultured Campylobacterales bacterium]